jgi:hypothetical protein
MELLMKSATERRMDCTANWKSALAHYQGQLRYCAVYLLPCGCSERVIKQAEKEVIGTVVLDEFKLSFLLRTLVKMVIKHVDKCTYGTRARYTDSDFEDATADEGLPTYERIAYFLRQILKCQTRDASLLMGVSDTQVETLFCFACRRLEMGKAVSRPEMRLATGTAFVGIAPSIPAKANRVTAAVEGFQAALRF